MSSIFNYVRDGKDRDRRIGILSTSRYYFCMGRSGELDYLAILFHSDEEDAVSFLWPKLQLPFKIF